MAITERVSVTPPEEFRKALRAHAAELGVEDLPLSRAIMDLAEEGFRARLQRASEKSMEALYAAWADDQERAAANEAVMDHANESGLF